MKEDNPKGADPPHLYTHCAPQPRCSCVGVIANIFKLHECEILGLASREASAYTNHYCHDDTKDSELLPVLLQTRVFFLEGLFKLFRFDLLQRFDRTGVDGLLQFFLEGESGLEGTALVDGYLGRKDIASEQLV